MKKMVFYWLMLWAAGLAGVRAANAQPGPVSIRPDCFQFFTFTVPANSAVFDNRSAGCPYFAIAYSSNGFSVESLVVQVAPDAGGTPGAWSTYTPNSGVNPNTAITEAFSTFSGYFPWVRVQLTSVTGTGSISGILYGWRTPATIIASGSGSASGCTVGTPCVVQGPTTAGNSTLNQNPVMIGGQDNNTGLQTIIDTDAAGNLRMVGRASNAVEVAGQQYNTGAIHEIDVDGNGGILLGVSTASPSDGIPNASANLVGVGGTSGQNASLQMIQLLFNGTTWDRKRTAALANFPTSQTFTGVNSIGANLSEKGARWSKVSSPTAGTVASGSIAAEASVRHVVDCVSFSATASAAITTNSLTVVVRDGATGAGTVIWQWVVNPVNAGTGAQSVQPHSICGLNLTGTTNTAMTAEFSAGVANVTEAVSLSGFNVN